MNHRVLTELVKEYRETYLKEYGLGTDSDKVLGQQLTNAYNYIQERVAPFDIEKENMGKQLVFERMRYVRANAGELFFQNFFHDLNAFSHLLQMKSGEEDVT